MLKSKILMDKTNPIYRFFTKEIQLSRSPKFNDQDMSLLFAEISLMLSGGLDLVKIFEINILEARGWKKKAFLEIKNQLLTGKFLSKSMEETKAFPILVIGMINVAEYSGSLVETFAKLSQYYKNQNTLKKKVANAMAYPILLAITCFFVIQVIFYYVFPIFVEVFDGSKTSLPLSTEIMILLSRHFALYGIFYYLFIFFLIFCLFAISKHSKGKKVLDRIALKLPIIGRIKEGNFELFFISSMLIQLKTGVDILQVIKNAQDLSKNSYFKEKLYRIEARLKKGESLFSSLSKEELLSRKTRRMIQMGEDSSRLYGILEVCEKSLRDSYEEKIDKFNTYIEPALILFMATIVGFIVFSIAIPMFDLVNQI